MIYLFFWTLIAHPFQQNPSSTEAESLPALLTQKPRRQDDSLSKYLLVEGMMTQLYGPGSHGPMLH